MEINFWGEEIINNQGYSNDVLEIHLAGITNPNPNYKMFKNVTPSIDIYDYYVFEYVLSGVGHIETPEGKYTVSKGDMYFLNKLRQQIYYSDKKEPYKKEFIVFKGILADKLAEIYEIDESVIIKKIDIHSIFSEIFDILKNGEKIPNDTLEGLIFRLFQQIRKPMKNDKHNKNGIAYTIRDYLHLHVREKLTVSKISEELYTSVSVAQHAFAKEFNCSLMKYFSSIKIDIAKKLLTQTESSIAYIAYYLAFEDKKYFSKCFKKETGMTPNQYRKKYTEAIGVMLQEDKSVNGGVKNV